MRRFLFLLAACLLVAPCGNALADTVVATLDAPTPLSAYAGGLLWSQTDPGTGAFALMYAPPGGPPHALPVAQRPLPFDAQLGPDANGRTVAARVYLDKVAIGPLDRQRVEALVAQPGAMTQSLLGMSFLSRLRSYEFTGDFLTLRG